jgi:hypothetical protein
MILFTRIYPIETCRKVRRSPKPLRAGPDIDGSMMPSVGNSDPSDIRVLFNCKAHYSKSWALRWWGTEEGNSLLKRYYATSACTLQGYPSYNKECTTNGNRVGMRHRGKLNKTEDDNTETQQGKKFECIRVRDDMQKQKS